MSPILHQVLVSPKVGGAAVVAIRLAAAVSRLGLESVGWVPGKGPASEALASERITARVYGFDDMRGSNAKHLVACARMWPGLAAVRRPIVHVHNPIVYRMIWPALVAARARTVVHFHIEPTTDEIEWTLQRPPDQVVGCAEYIADRVRQVLGERAAQCRVSAAPNGVNIQKYAPQDPTGYRERAAKSRRPVLLMMANLAPHKGQATAIRAVKVLKERGIPVECWLAGEDREGRAFETELHRLVSSLGLEDDVRFLGYRSDGPALFQLADAFLLPSTHEGLPLSILEAQAARVPVLGAPIPGIAEVVEDGQTGFIVAADDHQGYADRLEQLFRNPDLRDKLVARAAARVPAYSLEAFERRMFQIYDALSPEYGIAARAASLGLSGATGGVGLENAGDASVSRL